MDSKKIVELASTCWPCLEKAYVFLICSCKMCECNRLKYGWSPFSGLAKSSNKTEWIWFLPFIHFITKEDSLYICILITPFSKLFSVEHKVPSSLHNCLTENASQCWKREFTIYIHSHYSFGFLYPSYSQWNTKCHHLSIIVWLKMQANVERDVVPIKIHSISPMLLKLFHPFLALLKNLQGRDFLIHIWPTCIKCVSFIDPLHPWISTHSWLYTWKMRIFFLSSIYCKITKYPINET